MPVVAVARVGDLRERRGRVVAVGSRELALFRDGGRIHALDNECVHNGGPLGEGDVVDGCVVCPWHGWRYVLDTGASPVNAAIGVRTYPAWADDDGTVLVDVPDDWFR